MFNVSKKIGYEVVASFMDNKKKLYIPEGSQFSLIAKQQLVGAIILKERSVKIFEVISIEPVGYLKEIWKVVRDDLSSEEYHAEVTGNEVILRRLNPIDSSIEFEIKMTITF